MRGGTKAHDLLADDIRINNNDVHVEVGCFFSEVRKPLHYITMY